MCTIHFTHLASLEVRCASHHTQGPQLGLQVNHAENGTVATALITQSSGASLMLWHMIHTQELKPQWENTSQPQPGHTEWQWE